MCEENRTNVYWMSIETHTGHNFRQSISLVVLVGYKIRMHMMSSPESFLRGPLLKMLKSWCETVEEIEIVYELQEVTISSYSMQDKKTSEGKSFLVGIVKLYSY